MKVLAFLLSFFLYVQLTVSYYSYTVYLGYSSIIKSASLAPTTYKNQNGTYVNIAFLYSNGSLKITSTNALAYSYSSIFPTGIVNSIDWNEAGISLIGDSTVTIYDPVTLAKNLTINTTNGIIKGKSVLRTNPSNKFITAIAFSNRIQVYSNDILMTTRSLTNGFQGMAFDVTGNYLYYFDAYYRYVLDLTFFNIFSSTSTSQVNRDVKASSKQGFQDITVSLDITYGYLRIWDDYGLLNTYSNPANQRFICFSDDSKYLITMQDYKFNVWLTDYTNFTKWRIVQNQSISIYSPDGMDVKNGMFIYYSNQYIYLYNYQNNPDPDPVPPKPPTSTTLIIIIISVIGILICIGIVVICFKKKRAQNSQNYQSFDNQHSNNQGWDNQGWNNQGVKNQGWKNQSYNQGYNPYPNNTSNPYNSN